MSGVDTREIQALFRQEAEGRLATLGRLLLELEQETGDRELVNSIFREVHTIKGSAALAGFGRVSDLAHELEELVEQVRAGARPVDAESIDTLLTGIDQLGAAVAGDPDTGDGRQPPPASIPPAPRPEPAEPSEAPHPPDVARHGPRQRDHAEGVVAVPMRRLDELVRLVGESASAHLRMGRMLRDRFGVDPASLAEFDRLSRCLNDLQDRTMRTRMVPVSTVTDRLRRAVRDLARAQGKDVRWEVRGADTELDRGVLSGLSDALLHLVRNAVDHGIEPAPQRQAAGKPATGTVRLHAMQLGSEVIIAVTDDGPGIDLDRVRGQAARLGLDTDGMTEAELRGLIFRSGLSTAPFVTDVSGRGVGLDVVRCNVEAAGGRVEVRSAANAGTEIRIIVPITLAVLRCLLVEAGGEQFGLPFHRVVCSREASPQVATHAEGRPAIWVDGSPVPVTDLTDTLALPADAPSAGPVVVLADTTHRHGFRVSRLLGRRDVVLKGLSRQLPHLPVVAGASVEPDGSVLLVLDPPGLLQRARLSVRPDDQTGLDERPPAERRRILVVDDALTVRELQRSILARAGFDVQVATDGVQALSTLAERPVDLVLTDVEMPNMDGFALTEAIRAHPALANIPVLILTSRTSDADRQRGLDAGADGYILKSGFDQGNLLDAVHRLLGGRPGGGR